MISVSVGEAKNRLPFFLHLVESGEEVQITRHGKNVAS
ncbi:MAG: type II toxin-antitoxin system prevent-host-death family antitoxin, partial [Treponema sp.]|nr:type II toxin-antitoxin system prevent-host-death family antitoxin [Treponema sp.]MCR4823124.1 type II toxin-antitoxin system prevent-host-death family antitoxin [Treponema sp.]